MMITGLDLSPTSSGIVKAELDNDTLEIIKLDWMGFCDVAKTAKLYPKNLRYYKKFPVYLDRTIWMRNEIDRFLDVTSFVDWYAAVEDYAFSSTGKTYHIGGFTEIIKLMLYEWRVKLRLYDITIIKKFATKKGDADKIRMYDEYMKIPVDQRIDLSKLDPVDNSKGKSPTSDIIDAYFIMKILQMELKLRKGLLQLRDLTEEQIWVFNRVTEKGTENILTRDFINIEKAE